MNGRKFFFIRCTFIYTTTRFNKSYFSFIRSNLIFHGGHNLNYLLNVLLDIRETKETTTPTKSLEIKKQKEQSVKNDFFSLFLINID